LRSVVRGRVVVGERSSFQSVVFQGRSFFWIVVIRGRSSFWSVVVSSFVWRGFVVIFFVGDFLYGRKLVVVGKCKLVIGVEMVVVLVIVLFVW
jgi:hypothetical protein